jgi:hypothetical protein
MQKSVEGGLNVSGWGTVERGGGAHRYPRNKKHYSNRTWPAAVSSTVAVRTVTTTTAEVSINYLMSPAKHAVDHEAIVRDYQH